MPNQDSKSKGHRPGKGKRSLLERLIHGELTSSQLREVDPALYQGLKINASPALLAFHATRFRLIADLTQAEAAQRLQGVHRSTLQRVEGGRHQGVGLRHIDALCWLYGTRIEDLFQRIDVEALPPDLLKHPRRSADGLGKGSQGPEAP